MNFWKFLSSFLGGSQTVNIPETAERQASNKRSLHVGINDYPGRRNDLRGCVNDCKDWSKYCYKVLNIGKIKQLFNNKATVKNVKKVLTNMVANSKSGDHLIFTFSGHGTSVPDKGRKDEADGKDEALCLYDGLLLDDDIQDILAKLPEGVRFTFISDSCHSGTVTRDFLMTIGDNSYDSAPRYMPPEDIKENEELAALPVKKKAFNPNNNMQEVLLSGCQAHEYSYDARFGGKPMGAFSYNALNILNAAGSEGITYRDFYAKLRQSLPSKRYPQTPQLEGSDEHLDRKMFS
jgi:hypothetical protein